MVFGSFWSNAESRRNALSHMALATPRRANSEQKRSVKRNQLPFAIMKENQSSALPQPAGTNSQSLSTRAPLHVADGQELELNERSQILPHGVVRLGAGSRALLRAPDGSTIFLLGPAAIEFVEGSFSGPVKRLEARLLEGELLYETTHQDHENRNFNSLLENIIIWLPARRYSAPAPMASVSGSLSTKVEFNLSALKAIL